MDHHLQYILINPSLKILCKNFGFRHSRAVKAAAADFFNNSGDSDMSAPSLIWLPSRTILNMCESTIFYTDL